jgi:hypothetical protein
VPESIEVVIDVRNPPERTEAEVHALMDSWCCAAGPGVTHKIEIMRFVEQHPDSFIDPQCASTSMPSFANF